MPRIPGGRNVLATLDFLDVRYVDSVRVARVLSRLAGSSTLVVLRVRSIWRFRPVRTLPGPTSM